jgi:hypothetical protein
MAEPSPSDHDQRYNRDEEMKPPPAGQPPRPATEPKGAEKSGKDAPTATDPQTGEPNRSKDRAG